MTRMIQELFKGMDDNFLQYVAVDDLRFRVNDELDLFR